MNLLADLAAVPRASDPYSPIRELSDAQFFERYACERFTASRVRPP
jgi:N-methylhydantoinase B